MDKDLKQPKEKKVIDKTRRKKIVKRSIIGVFLVLIAAFIGYRYIAVRNIKPQVTTRTAAIGDVEQVINTSGNVKTELTKVYFADIALPIERINVSLGDVVARGDQLMTFQADAIAEEKQLAELKKQSGSGSYNNSMQNNGRQLAELTEANTNIPVLDQQIADTEALIQRLEAQIARKQADIANEGALLQISLQEWSYKPDSEEYKNISEQIQHNGVQQQHNKEIIAWQAELKSAQNTLSQFKEYRSEMKSQRNASESGRMTSGSRSELDANLKTQELEFNQSLSDLELAEQGITADFSGVVTGVEVVEGATTAIGGKLFTLESTEDVVVEIMVSKFDLEKIKEGLNADVTIAGANYQGQVSKISKMAVPNTNGTPVVATEIKILNPDENIYLGVEAKIVIHTAQVNDVVILPVEAVNVDKEGEFVYAVENNVIAKKRVAIGISSDSYIEIQEGLQDGSAYLMELPAGLDEGMEVTAVPEESEAIAADADVAAGGE